MRVRHRLSTLLLRQGLVFHRFDRRGVQLAFDEALDTVFIVHARRDRSTLHPAASTDPDGRRVGGRQREERPAIDL